MLFYQVETVLKTAISRDRRHTFFNGGEWKLENMELSILIATFSSSKLVEMRMRSWQVGYLGPITLIATLSSVV